MSDLLPSNKPLFHGFPLTQRTAAILAVIGVAGAGLYAAHRSSSSSSDTDTSSSDLATYSGTAYDPTTGLPVSGAAGTYDSTENDLYDDLQPQVQAIADAQSQLTSASSQLDTDTTALTAAQAAQTASTATLNKTLNALPKSIAKQVKAALPKPAKATKPKANKPAPKPAPKKGQPKAAPKTPAPAKKPAAKAPAKKPAAKKGK